MCMTAACPAHSLDVNPLDFLMRHLKSLVYKTPVLDESDLRNRIIWSCMWFLNVSYNQWQGDWNYLILCASWILVWLLFVETSFFSAKNVWYFLCCRRVFENYIYFFLNGVLVLRRKCQLIQALLRHGWQIKNYFTLKKLQLTTGVK